MVLLCFGCTDYVIGVAAGHGTGHLISSGDGSVCTVLVWYKCITYNDPRDLRTLPFYLQGFVGWRLTIFRICSRRVVMTLFACSFVSGPANGFARCRAFAYNARLLSLFLW